MMENFRFDLCFMGVVGADVMENAITTYVPEDGAMKQSAISKSRRSYLMMETKKFDFQANYVFADFTQIDGVICETEPSEQVRAALKEFGTEIIV